MPGSPPPHVVELTVKGCSELFDATAPSCLGRRILHDKIAEHLLEDVADAPGDAPLKLRLNVPAAEAAQAQTVGDAIRAHFEARRGEEQRRFRQIFRHGRNATLISLVFLIFVNALGQSIRTVFSGRFAEAVANGLEIFGWVAMWRPAELLLYDWMPVRRQRNLLARLAKMEVDFCPTRD
jgi:hypothetical protein